MWDIDPPRFVRHGWHTHHREGGAVQYRGTSGRGEGAAREYFNFFNTITNLPSSYKMELNDEYRKQICQNNSGNRAVVNG
jgi:hypothetical protein